MVKISTLLLGQKFKFPNGKIVYILEEVTGWFKPTFHYRNIKNNDFYESDGNDFVVKLL